MPHYTKQVADDKHFQQLRQQVLLAVEGLPSSRLRVARAKAFLLPLGYAGLYVLALLQTNYFLFCLAYSILGLMLVIIFLNLIHEASHRILFKNKRSNDRFMLLFDLIGANSYMWNRRHLRLHHNYTNVDGWDSDISKSKYLKVHPEAANNKGQHYQHLIVAIYPLFITNWFLVRDFKDFFLPKMIVRKIGKVPRAEFVKLFAFKMLFVGYMVWVPAFITPFSLMQSVAALFAMLLTAGLFALSVLLPPHVNIENQFPVANAKMALSQSWFMHQLNTTNDVTKSNWFTRHVMANSNFHIAHHLFPNISYVYAREVTDVIKKYTIAEGLPYRSYPMFTTFKNHYKLMKRNGQAIHILEEDM